jgi:hypothetical protein
MSGERFMAFTVRCDDKSMLLEYHPSRVKFRTMRNLEPLPKGRYRTLVIDPPWPVEKILREVRLDQAGQLDHKTLSTDDIKAFPINDVLFELL